MRPARRTVFDAVEMTFAFILVLPGMKAFCFSDNRSSNAFTPLHWSLNCNRAQTLKRTRDQMHMKIILPAVAILGFAGIAIQTSAQPSGYASSVLSYDSGSGFAIGYTNASSALGEPSRVTPGQFGGPVDPFSPA